MKEVPLSQIKDDLSRFLREADTQEIVITRHRKPAGVLIGFRSEEDWFEYRLELGPRFLRRIEQARNSLHAEVGSGWRILGSNDWRRVRDFTEDLAVKGCEFTPIGEAAYGIGYLR